MSVSQLPVQFSGRASCMTGGGLLEDAFLDSSEPPTASCRLWGRNLEEIASPVPSKQPELRWSLHEQSDSRSCLT